MESIERSTPSMRSTRCVSGEHSIRVARTYSQRLRGLLFAQPRPGLTVFSRCHDVHTFFMNYAIDIAFVDKSGQVLGSFRNVEPGCRIRQPGAWAAVERSANRMRPWYEQGSYVDACIVRALHRKD